MDGRFSSWLKIYQNKNNLTKHTWILIENVSDKANNSLDNIIIEQELSSFSQELF